MMHFNASQCAFPGFWMNWASTPTAWAMSGRKIITGHRTLLIAAVYGTPLIRIVFMMDIGPCSLVRTAPGSIGVLIGFAFVSLNFSVIDSMYAH